MPTPSLNIAYSERDANLTGVERLRGIAEWTGHEQEWVWEGLSLAQIVEVFDLTMAADYDWPTGWAEDNPETFKAAFDRPARGNAVDVLWKHNFYKRLAA